MGFYVCLFGWFFGARLMLSGIFGFQIEMNFCKCWF